MHQSLTPSLSAVGTDFAKMMPRLKCSIPETSLLGWQRPRTATVVGLMGITRGCSVLETFRPFDSLGERARRFSTGDYCAPQ